MNDLIKILQLYSPLISLLTFFLGLYIGNKHAIGRDKRQEFNERAEPIIDYFDYMQSWFEQRVLLLHSSYQNLHNMLNATVI
ncbi:hypothetical protein [Arsenophonus nasoniae]|uniref:Uncharacterized protein n=1 Tax=Arsenophonus nasoniae TaxID=638 RepID=A0A4P7KW28_9GAMM|nr:hypothetical protein [Arsenophonus nasoniae]QBY44221.1 hypothetical protein ArsFIN_27980 [Arsenophonus nasoniae]